jgi:hypothetical protein
MYICTVRETPSGVCSNSLVPMAAVAGNGVHRKARHMKRACRTGYHYTGEAPPSDGHATDLQDCKCQES